MDWLCVKMYQHSRYKKFDTEELMSEYWQKCHKITLTDWFAPFVLADATKEPSPRMKLPSTVKGESQDCRTRSVSTR